MDRLKHIIDRMNFLGGLSEEEREARREDCQKVGSHIPTGEVFLTNPVTHTCYHCGERFKLD